MKLKQKSYVFMLSCAIVCFSTVSFSQAVRNGDGLLSFGLGIGQGHYAPGTYGTYSSRTSIGPITAGYQKIITDVIGVGRFGVGGSLGMSFHSSKYRVGNTEIKNSATRTVLMVRGSYHFDLPSKNWDLYGGLGLGLYLYSYKYDSYWGSNTGTSSASTLAFSFFLGARYFFSDSFGVYAELGHGLGNLNLGLTFKI